MDSLFLDNPFVKGGISFILKKLSQLECNISLEYLREAWQEDLGINITEGQWDDAQKLVHSSSICARHGVIQFKVLHRLHLSKEKLSKMFPSVDSTCDRCGQSGASLAHMFWMCPKIITYWSTIFQIMSDIIKRPLDPDPVLALFGVKDDNITISKSQYSVITFVMLLARRLILLNWKQKIPPTHFTWIKDVMQYLQLERIRFSIKDKAYKFYDTWGCFIDYFETDKVLFPL